MKDDETKHTPGPRLIAAAPDLLDALKFIEELTAEELQYAKVGTGAEVALRHAHRRAGEAIAKAEGQGKQEKTQ